MANCYSAATACDIVPCNKFEAEKVNELLQVLEYDTLGEGKIHGFKAEYYDCDGVQGVYMYAPDEVNIDALPEAALKYLGELMIKADVPHLEFGISYTCDKVWPDSHGGVSFRIYPDGFTEIGVLTWTR